MDNSMRTKWFTNTVQILSNQKKITLLLCIIILCIIYIELKDVINDSQIEIQISVIISSMKMSLLSKTAKCYRSDGSTFISIQLEPLYRKNFSKIFAYINANSTSKVLYILNSYSNLTEFIEKTSTALMSRRLVPAQYSIELIFRYPPYYDLITPACDGLWMEFGVFRGGSISHIALWKRLVCGNTSSPVYGFDTFTGLPTHWRSRFVKGAFELPSNETISVPSNVVLIKGLFNNTLPEYLHTIDQQYQCQIPVSFVHIDCDTYESTKDVLHLLRNRIVSGTFLVFDELFNYPDYEKHEIKALFEFISNSNLRLIPIGASGQIYLHPEKDFHPQSFGFIVDK